MDFTKYISFDALVVFNVALAVVMLAVLVLFFWYRAKIRKLFRGTEGADLEKVLFAHGDTIAKNAQEIAFLKQEANEMRDANMRNFQKSAIKRFNPFKDIGGDQSFILALLDGKNNGFVVTSLYREDGARVYAKPITHGVSSHNLTADEKEILEKAMGVKKN